MANAASALNVVLFQPVIMIGAISARYNEATALTAIAPNNRNFTLDSARPNRQADALSFTGRPFSFIRPCSSPAWNISRTMSQPPTNSPLT